MKSTSAASIFWYDLETFGIDPKYHRIAQFAGIRTDVELNIIDDPLVLYCKPSDDFFPDPYACMVTGITPQLALDKGVTEAEFISTIEQQFSRANTCVAGYNNIRFDDEFIRYCLYRNFFDPYAREWKHGNSRWDILDVVRLTKALRPEGINWPSHSDGKPSFKLEYLTSANGIAHEAAHDALSDIYATIAMAKLIRQHQPKLYDFVFHHRDKQSLISLLNIREQKPVIHVSGMYSVEKGCLALVLPLAVHPLNKNGIIVYDLSMDPTDLIHLSTEQIRERLFTPKDELPDGVERVPLKTIHINKCPIVVPANTLNVESAQRLQLDKSQCMKHYETLRQQADLSHKIQAVFSERPSGFSDDPDFNLYGGFFSDHDRRQMDVIRSTPVDKLAQLDLMYEDSRIPEMLFRYRARNFYATLTQNEKKQWQSFRRQRLNDTTIGLDVDAYISQLQQLRADENLDAKEKNTLDQLLEYAQTLMQT